MVIQPREYVALTRAERFLFVSHNGTRTSRFIKELGSIIDGAGGTVTNDSKRILNDIRYAPLEHKREVQLGTSFSDLRYYLGCPHDFYLRKVLGFAPTIDQAFGYGRGVHNLMRAIHSNPKKWAALARDDGVLKEELAELSEFFGTQLTVRAGRTLRLTLAGERVARMAREQFLAIQAFREGAKGVAPAFTIGAGDNLMQWLLVPAIGRIRRDKHDVRVTLCNLRTKPIVERLKDRRFDFGIVRSDAVVEPLEHVAICEQRYALFVPRRLVTSRLLGLKDALLGTPQATIAGEGQLVERLRELAENLGGKFAPDLICDSMGQCLAAVKSGAFAAVLPVHAWAGAAVQECVVIEDEALEALSRKLVLAWHPKTLELIGEPAKKLLHLLTGALKKAAEDALTG